MAIKKIRISNFKSFKDLEIELGRFNVLIGANASGKSNFIQIFKFLKDITNHGLDNAISMQGGVEYLRNVNIGSSENFSIEIVSDYKFVFRLGMSIEAKTYETIYKLALKFKGGGEKFEIADDKLILKSQFVRLKEQKTEKKIEQREIIISNIKGKVTFDLNPPEGIINREDMSPPFWMEQRIDQRIILLERPPSFAFIPPGESENIFNNFSDTVIYDFDPKLPKEAIPIAGKAELEENGKNLAIVLKNIIEDKDKKRKFSNLIKDLLLFIDDVDVEKFADKSLLFKLRENYFKSQYLPAFLISDGTINIAALIIALYFEEKPLIIIEEPERNIHPYLISRVVDMMKDASRNKQIIITTHNPEIVKYADLENILLVSRDKEGFSTISRPAEKEEIKIFLKNEIGVEELYVQNLLGI